MKNKITNEMTNSELKKKITEASDVEWFKTIQTSFNFHYVNFVQPFTGLSAIYEFVNQQLSGWEKIEGPIPSEMQQSKTYFENVKAQIIQFVNSYINQSGSNLNSYWSNVRNSIDRIQEKPLPYHLPQTQFLIKIFNETPVYYPGAYSFLLNTSNLNVNNRDTFYGAILAYEFTLKDKTNITDRRKSEQSSISKIRTDFQKYLSESENQRIEHLSASNTKFEDYVRQIDNLKETKNKLFDEWFENTKNEEWQKWYTSKIAKLQKLEETYETKLKLEKPAKYWDVKSKKHYAQGNKAKYILFILIGLSAIFLGSILLISPDWIFFNVFKGNSAALVRWSILFLSLISLVVFGVRIVSRIMLSSFHLARDAEERHTLTFFYLALLKDSEIKDDERKLIMQSLFSRSETGLLKEDSSPTMPNDILTKLINRT
jgi:hypothetical protein